MGNTYNICYHLWRSGGAEIIFKLMEAGALYVGSSAGSIMAGKTCQMALWKNWDDQTCEGTVRVDWSDKEVAKGLDLAGGRSIFVRTEDSNRCTWRTRSRGARSNPTFAAARQWPICEREVAASMPSEAWAHGS